jgi:hypothetical protein
MAKEIIFMKKIMKALVVEGVKKLVYKDIPGV